MTREQKREQMRTDFPLMAQVADDFKRIFGDGVRVRWAQENGKEVGTPGPQGVIASATPKPFKRTEASRKR
jgi:hypothetical protein